MKKHKAVLSFLPQGLAFAAVFAVLLLSCPVPLQAQSGIDSLSSGGDLGGDGGNDGQFEDMGWGDDLGGTATGY